MKIDRKDYPIFKFIANGVVKFPFIGEGRPFPSLIFEKNTALIITELCKAHENPLSGDAETTWGTPISLFKPKEFILKITFKNPIETTFGISFEGKKHFSLIDGIIHSQSLRIEAGNFGDKISDLRNSDILIEVPKTKFANKWNSYLEDILRSIYKQKGVHKKELKKVVNQHIKSMREVWDIRNE